ANAAGYKNWVNGDANGNKSHWRENDFISYRVTVVAQPGSHDIEISYDTVHGGKHAIDYLGSFDATETTATSAGAFNPNYNNPCQDLVDHGDMPQSTGSSAPGAQVAAKDSSSIPPATLANCGGSAGASPAQQPGVVEIFGPAGTTVGTPAYTDENNPSG